jgi:hypothetical protein
MKSKPSITSQTTIRLWSIDKPLIAQCRAIFKARAAPYWSNESAVAPWDSASDGIIVAQSLREFIRSQQKP